MKKLSVLVIVVMLVVMPLSSCSSYKANEVVYVYNWGEYIDSSVNDMFEEETGIKVIYDEYDNNESMYATLKNGAAKYDVIFPSDYMISRLIEEDMVEPLNFDNIPNYQYIMDNFKGLEYDPENKYSVPYTWGIIGLLYNKEYVTETPTSWSALWDERYSGKTLMYNNSRDAIGLTLIKNNEDVNTTDTAVLDTAAEEVKTLKKNLQAFVSDEIFNLMESGSAYMTPAYGGDVITMMEENSDLGYVIPQEGTNLFVDAMCVVKGSENKEAAEKYINFLCREDIAALNREETCYSTPQQQVYEGLDEETKNELIAYPTDDILEKSQVYTNLPQETLDYYSSLWTNIKNS